MSGTPSAPVTDTRTYNCPCCGQQYQARITESIEYEDPEGNIIYLPGGLVWGNTVKRAKTPQGELMQMCSVCHEPCCPRCVCVFGEGMVSCTRCTTNRTCDHSGESYGG